MQQLQLKLFLSCCLCQLRVGDVGHGVSEFRKLEDLVLLEARTKRVTQLFRTLMVMGHGIMFSYKTHHCIIVGSEFRSS